MSKKLLLAFFSILLSYSSEAQTTFNAYWFRYFNQLHFNNRWSWQNEIDERRSIQPDQQRQFIIHSYANVKVSRKTDLSAGVTCSWVTNTKNLTVPEPRLIQSVTYATPLTNRLSILGRFRVEERFFRNTSDDGTKLEPGHHFRFRSRYRWQMMMALDNEQKWNARVSDEIMFHTDAADPWSFDQNRVSASLEYRFSKPVSLEIGYMFINAHTATQTVQSNVIRTTLYHRIFLKEE